MTPAQTDVGLQYWQALLVRNTQVISIDLDEWENFPQSELKKYDLANLKVFNLQQKTT